MNCAIFSLFGSVMTTNVVFSIFCLFCVTNGCFCSSRFSVLSSSQEIHCEKRLQQDLFGQVGTKP